MTWLLAVGVFATVSAGAYLALSRHLLRCVVGISLVAAAANLVVFAAGRPEATAPPIIAAGASVLEQAANPLPQALVLTAIVIGFALTCFSLVVALAIKQRTGSSDSDTLRTAEPRPAADGSPALEVDENGAPEPAGDREDGES